MIIFSLINYQLKGYQWWSCLIVFKYIIILYLTVTYTIIYFINNTEINLIVNLIIIKDKNLIKKVVLLCE